MEDKKVRENIIEGRNPVLEALKKKRTIEQIMITKGDKEGVIKVIIAKAKEDKIPVKEVDKRKLDAISETKAHQGVIAITSDYTYCQVEDILNYAKEKGEEPIIIILDEIEDPHNFGAIIRSAEVLGAHGIIIPSRRNVGITPTVSKGSAGAIEWIKIAKVTNINREIDFLKENGVWIYGADMEGESYSFQESYLKGTAIVIGSEANGMSRLTKEKCDKLVKIPMSGNISSLNASVALGMLLYEVKVQRLKNENSSY